MTIVNGYASLADIKAHIGVTDTVDDAQLERVVEVASRAIDDYTGRRFYLDAAPSSRVFYPTNMLVAEVDDISTASGLVVKTDNDDTGTYETTWDANMFVLLPLNANVASPEPRPYSAFRAINGNSWPTWNERPSLQVTAQWGWPDAVPGRVTYACLLKAARLFRRKASPDGIAGSAEYGIVRISRQEDPDVCGLLAHYCKGGNGSQPGVG